MNEQIEDDVCNLFGFCYCGVPWLLTRQLKEYLEYYAQDWNNNTPEWCKDEWIWIAYLCDKEGLTEHRTSIGFVWLTDEGKKWLKKLKQYEEEK